MDEGRKRVILIAASILAARKLQQVDGVRKVPATVSAVADAVRWAEMILKEIDERWPAGKWGGRACRGLREMMKKVDGVEFVGRS